MNPIIFGNTNYNSPYGSAKLQDKIEQKAKITESNADSFKKSNKHGDTPGIIASVVATVAGAIALIKGRGKLSSIAKSLKGSSGQIKTTIKDKLTKLPKLSTVLTNAKNSVVGLFSKIGKK